MSQVGDSVPKWQGMACGQPRGPGLLQEGDRQGQEPGGGGAVVAMASSPRASGFLLCT